MPAPAAIALRTNSVWRSVDGPRGAAATRAAYRLVRFVEEGQSRFAPGAWRAWPRFVGSMTGGQDAPSGPKTEPT